VTVGEALAEARTRAGLSVGEISERTRIRESVILGIERDDYDACGGDLFVRGYVRVIADAVGIDAQPLINIYDETHAGKSTWYRVPGPVPTEPAPAPAPEPEAEPASVPDPQPVADADAEPVADPEPGPEPGSAPDPSAESDATRLDLPSVNLDDTTDDIPVIRLDDTVSDIEPVPAEDAPKPAPALTPKPERTPSPKPAPAQGPEPDPAPGEPSAAPDGKTAVLPAAAASGPDMPWVLRKGRDRAARGRRRMIGIGAVVVVVLAAVGVGVALASSSRGGTGKPPAVASSSAPTAHSTTGGAGSTDSAGKGGGLAGVTAGRAATPTPSPTARQRAKAHHAAKPAPRVIPARALSVPLAEAFGPDGTSDGDNPQSAMNVVNAKSTQPWSTDWYTTAEFGMLKQGTGLLLDMGSTVTITSVEADLGPAYGANVQVLAGNSPELSELRLAVSGDGAGGSTYFRLRSPRSARYVLIWFTKLPVASSGQYQGSIYSVVVTGHS
jgi:hypothetical protein